MKKFLSFLFAGVFVLGAMAACEGGDPTDPIDGSDDGNKDPQEEENTAPDVKLDKKELTLVIGRQHTLVAQISGSANAVWSSDDESVAKVSGGVVTAVAEGTANVTATIVVEDVSYAAVCAVTVEKTKVYAVMTAVDTYVEFRVGGSGVLMIEWGDGVVEDKVINGEDSFLSHSHANSKALQTITLSGGSDLKIKLLDCASMRLASLDVSGCTALSELNCSSCFLDNLDIKGCAALESLECSSNLFYELDASGHTSLKYIVCKQNKLRGINVGGCTALEYLACDNNELQSLDVSGCTALTGVSCANNKLTTLKMDGCKALKNLGCEYNQLTSLDLGAHTALASLTCFQNQLKSLNLDGCTKLESINCAANTLIASLDFEGNTNLEHVTCSSIQLQSLKVKGCSSLEYLYCMNNSLTSLDITGCTKLNSLNCSWNQIPASGLNAVFSALPTAIYGNLWIKGNAGYSTCNKDLIPARWLLED